MVIMDNQVNNSLSKCRIITQKSYTRCQISLLLLMNYSQLPSLGPLPLSLNFFFFIVRNFLHFILILYLYPVFLPQEKESCALPRFK